MTLRTSPALLLLLWGWPASVASQTESDAELGRLLQRIPPRSPAAALESFEIDPGFRLELVAAEPDVIDPVAAAFDEHGKVYVVEIGQPPLTKKDAEPYPAGVLIYSVDATLATGKNPVIVYGRDGLKEGATYLTGHKFEDKDAPLKVEVGEGLKGGGFKVKVSVTKP